MFGLLRGGHQYGIQRHIILELVNDAIGRIALLALRGLVQQREHLLQPFHVPLRFRVVVHERLLQFLVHRLLCHLFRGSERSFLRIVDVRYAILQQFAESFGPCLSVRDDRRVFNVDPIAPIRVSVRSVHIVGHG